MANGVIIPTNAHPKIYSFPISNLPVSTAWGSLYLGSTSCNISDAGDLTTKKIIVSALGAGTTCTLSVDTITSGAVNVSFIRGTAGYFNGTIQIFVYD